MQIKSVENDLSACDTVGIGFVQISRARTEHGNIRVSRPRETLKKNIPARVSEKRVIHQQENRESRFRKIGKGFCVRLNIINRETAMISSKVGNDYLP